MKQIEITVRVNNSLEEINKILSKLNFKIIRKGIIKDKYLKPNNIELTKNNILEVLSRSVLLRYFSRDEKEYKKITYKKKTYDKDLVLLEEKISIDIDDIDSAYALFKAINYSLLVNVNYDYIVYKKDDIELCFQDVEGLGLLLEVESNKDFGNASNEEIRVAKEKLYNSLQEYGLNISKDYDIKKAYELILSSFKG